MISLSTDNSQQTTVLLYIDLYCSKVCEEGQCRQKLKLKSQSHFFVSLRLCVFASSNNA